MECFDTPAAADCFTEETLSQIKNHVLAQEFVLHYYMEDHNAFFAPKFCAIFTSNSEAIVKNVTGEGGKCSYKELYTAMELSRKCEMKASKRIEIEAQLAFSYAWDRERA